MLPEVSAGYRNRPVWRIVAFYMRIATALFQGRIENAKQLETMRLRRDELEEQIQSLTERRGQLIQQRLNAQAAGSPEVAQEYQTRIADLGQRIARMDKEWIEAGDAITAAVSRGIGEGQSGLLAPPTLPTPPTPPVEFIGVPTDGGPLAQNDVGRLMALEALGFVILGVVLWRYARRGQRSVSTGPQVEKLSQAVDAIAVEVERISENQRFVTKLLNEKLQPEIAASADAKDRADAPRSR
jgi:hypothetical protein